MTHCALRRIRAGVSVHRVREGHFVSCTAVRAISAVRAHRSWSLHQPVQFQRAEGELDHEPQSFGHIATAGRRGVRGIAQGSALEGA